ncbi:hypothetical protein CDAR_605621, partial [Caerostris darwini]
SSTLTMKSIFVPLLLLILNHGYSGAERYPDSILRVYPSKNRLREVFYDNRVIPEDTEVDVRLRKGYSET